MGGILRSGYVLGLALAAPFCAAAPVAGFEERQPYVPPPLYCGEEFGAPLGPEQCVLISVWSTAAAGWDSQSGALAGLRSSARVGVVIDDAGVTAVVGGHVDLGHPLFSVMPAPPVSGMLTAAFVQLGHESWIRAGLVDGTFDSLLSVRPSQKISDRADGFTAGVLDVMNSTGLGGLAVQAHADFGHGWSADLGLEDIAETGIGNYFIFPPDPLLGRPIAQLVYDDGESFILMRGEASMRPDLTFRESEATIYGQTARNRMEAYSVLRLNRNDNGVFGRTAAGVRIEALENIFVGVGGGAELDGSAIDYVLSADIGDDELGPSVGIMTRAYAGPSQSITEVGLSWSYAWENVKATAALRRWESTYFPSPLWETSARLSWNISDHASLTVAGAVNTDGGAKATLRLESAFDGEVPEME